MTNIGSREQLNIFRYRLSGYYHTSGISTTSLSNLDPALSTLYATPFYCPNDQKFDRIAVNNSGTGNMARIGVYADDGNIKPGAVVLDAGEVDLNTTGIHYIEIDLTLFGGQLYWLAFYNDATDYGTIRAVAVASHLSRILGYDLSLGIASGIGYYRTIGSYGALPNPFGTPTGIMSTTMPAVFLRRK